MRQRVASHFQKKCIFLFLAITIRICSGELEVVKNVASGFIFRLIAPKARMKNAVFAE